MTTLQRRERDTAYVAAVAQACNSAGDGPAILQALADLSADWADDARVITFGEGRQMLAAYATRTPEAEANDDGGEASLASVGPLRVAAGSRGAIDGVLALCLVALGALAVLLLMTARRLAILQRERQP